MAEAASCRRRPARSVARPVARLASSLSGLGFRPTDPITKEGRFAGIRGRLGAGHVRRHGIPQQRDSLASSLDPPHGTEVTVSRFWPRNHHLVSVIWDMWPPGRTGSAYLSPGEH
jgi:hypothetical protein